MGVTRSAVWDWENGRSQVPSNDVPRLAAALNVSLGDLYGLPPGQSTGVGADAILTDQATGRTYVLQANRWPLSAPDDYVPPKGLTFLRNYLRGYREDWQDISEEERQELRDFADWIKEQDG